MGLRNQLIQIQLAFSEVHDLVKRSFRVNEANSSSSHLTQLEERVMLSATPLAVVDCPEVDAAEEPEAEVCVECPQSEDVRTEDEMLSSIESLDEEMSSLLNESTDPIDVVLIDSSLTDVDVLVDAVDESAIVLLYDGVNGTIIDVLAQVEALSETTGSEIASLSILSHGDGGQFDLGGQVVTTEMTAEQESAWRSLADNFTDDANIYVYGCEVVDGSGEGQQLLDALSLLTGTEVYGSIDTTGFGGDWDLEAVSIGGEAELAEGAIVPFDEAALSTYEGTLAVSSLVAHWTFDDGSGQTLTDISGNGNDVTLGSTTGSDSNDPTWTIDGTRGSVLTFDGSDDYLSGFADSPTGDFTIAGWGTTTSGGASGFHVLYSAGDEIWLGVNSSNGVIYLTVGGENDYVETATGIWTEDTWHHLAGTWDGTTAHIYLDGSDLTLTTTGTLNDPNATTGVIGAYSSGGEEYWEGSIDDLAIFDEALDSTTINKLANDSPFTVDSTLVTDDGVDVTTGDVLSTCFEPNGDTLSIDSFTQGTDGTVVYNNDSTFTYTPDADFYGIDTFTYTINDGNSNTDTATVTVTVNSPLVIDLDADDSSAAGNDFATTFYIESGQVSIVDADGLLSDDTDTDLESLTVTITDLQDGVLEVLAADVSGTSITESYNSGTGVLTLSGTDTIANYLQVLRSVTYDHAGANPTNDSRSITFVANDGTLNSNTATTTVSFVQAARRILLSTDGDVDSPSGVPDLDSWTDGEAIEFSGIGYTFEPTGTSGSFNSVFNIDDFASSSTDITGLHIVGRDITVGSGMNTFDLNAGDVLIAIKDDRTLTSTNSLDVEKQDVFVFRPDSLDDYSSGTFFLLLDDPFNDNIKITGLSLVERETTVGGIVLSEGTFLLAESGKNASDDLIYFTADGVGSESTSGTESVLIDRGDINIGKEISGIELIERDTQIGDTTLSSGQILITIAGDDSSVGDNSISVKEEDIFYLEVTQAGDTTIANATLFFDGSNVGLDSGKEDLNALTFDITQDITPPKVSITRDDPNPTNADSVVFSVDFNEDVINVDASDFVVVLSGATANMTVTVGDAGDTDDTTYTVTVDTIDGDGTLGLDIAGGNDITDVASNALNTLPTTDEVYTIDNTLPLVSVTRDDPDLTNANSVVFSIDFSEDVTNVTADDFDLSLTGVSANATVTIGNAGDSDDSTYTLTIDTIAGDGTLGIDIAGDNDIISLTSQALNTSPSINEVYTIDNTAPTITASETIDSDANGQIDQIKITTDENLDDDFTGLTITVAGYTVTGYSSDLANDNIFYIDLTDSGSLDTGVTPSVTVTANSTLSDATSNNIAMDGGVAAADKAAPVITASQSFNVSEAASNMTSVGTPAVSESGLQSWTITAGNSDGIFAINSSTGEITVTDNSNLDYEMTTSYNLTLTVSDGVTTSSTETVTINVDNVNEDPTNEGSLPSDITVTEDVASNIDLSSIDLNDVDAGSSDLTVTLTTSTGGNITAAAGTGITVSGTSTARTLTGSLTDLNNYLNTPSNLNYLHGTSHTNGNDADTIQVNVNDNGNTGAGGGSNIDLGTVNIDITAVNNAPTATGESYSILQTEVLTVTSPGILANDQDADSDPLTAVLVSNVSQGVLTLSSDGSFTYTPDLSFFGTDSFTYEAFDGLASSPTVTVTIEVEALGQVVEEPVEEEPAAEPEPEPEPTPEAEPIVESEPVIDEPTAETEEATSASPEGVRPPTQAAKKETVSAKDAKQASESQDTAEADAESEELLVTASQQSTRGSEAAQYRTSQNDRTSQYSRSKAIDISQETAVNLMSTFKQWSTEIDQKDIDGPQLTLGIETSSVITVLSIGYVIWSIRGGLFLTSFVSVVPTWSFFDPLPILNSELESFSPAGEEESLSDLTKSE